MIQQEQKRGIRRAKRKEKTHQGNGTFMNGGKHGGQHELIEEQLGAFGDNFNKGNWHYLLVRSVSSKLSNDDVWKLKSSIMEFRC